METTKRDEVIEGVAVCTSLHENKDLFIVKSASEWIKEAKMQPTPKMLFGELWFEGEFCVMFASTNIGKSILAVQIGNSISRGEQIGDFNLEASKQPILYYDFELTAKQFQTRYSNKECTEEYPFDDNFKRIGINPNADIPTSADTELLINQALELSIIQTQAKVLIIDNLTFLRNGTETAKDALPLMKSLKALKAKYDLSILALAHTPKRDGSSPLTINDLQGSSMIGNFVDSCFAIGKSYSDDLRYIKQLKQRSCEHVYHSDNVVIAEVSKPSNFLKFDFTGYGEESEYLKQPNEKEKNELESNVKKLHSEGNSYRKIADMLNISKSRAERLANK